jgi:hypothetical protein
MLDFGEVHKTSVAHPSILNSAHAWRWSRSSDAMKIAIAAALIAAGPDGHDFSRAGLLCIPLRSDDKVADVDSEEDIMAIQVEGWILHPVQAGALASDQLPDQWRPIAEAADPDARCTAALALWPQDFLELAPEFTRQFTDQLTDVRAYLVDTEPVCGVDPPIRHLTINLGGAAGPVLVYEADKVVWIGRDPRTFTTPPQFWDLLPQPAQDFQRNVHAAFTAPNRESFGLMHPAHLQTVTEWCNNRTFQLPFDDRRAPGQEGFISTDRLLPVTRDSGNLWLCLSPDLPEGQVAMHYEGYVDGPKDFTTAFDELMVNAFDETW